jgi:hypothetical protein
MKVLLVMLYLWSGQVKLEQQPFKNIEECQIKAGKITEELTKDPRFEGGFGAWCVELLLKTADATD